jgi:glycerophosphoryl diester phosphodiesterase
VVQAQAVHPERVMCDAASVADWRRAGYLVHAWTADEPGELRRLAALGVDAIIVNDVSHARALLEG